MKLSRILIAFLGAALLLAPQIRAQGEVKVDKKDTPEIIFEDLLKQIDKAREVFDTIKDVETANKAEKSLDTVIAEMKKIVDRAEKLKENKLPEKEQEKLKKRLETLGRKFQTSAKKAAEIPEGFRVLKSFSVKMQEVGQKLRQLIKFPK